MSGPPNPNPEPNPQPNPAPNPGPVSWYSTFPADLKDMIEKDGFKDQGPEALAKAYTSLKPMIGADKIDIPKDGIWSDMARQKLGIPAKAEEYKYTKPTLPDGMTWDDGAAKIGLEALHKAGATPAIVQAAINTFAQMQIANHEAGGAKAAEATQQATAAQAAAQKALKTEWGQAYDTKVQFAGKAALHVGGEGLMKAMNETKLADGSALGDHPEVLKAFAKVGELLGEDTLKIGKADQSAMTPAEALAKANAIMNTPEFTSQNQEIRERAIAEVNKLFGMAHDNTRDIRGGVVVQAA